MTDGHLFFPEELRQGSEFRELESLATTGHHNAMNIVLPPDLESRLSVQSAALHLAIGLFADEEVTLGQAAEIAGLSQPEFLHELGKRRIPIHYGEEELAEDLQTVASWPSK